MKRRLVVTLFSALLFVAPFSHSKEPGRFMQPGTPVTFESYGFVIRATAPHGWSFTAEQGIVPPPTYQSSCVVRGRLHTEGDWNDFLVSSLRRTSDVRVGERVVMKIGGYPAVSDRYLRESSMIRDIYIDLSELYADYGAVLTFEGKPTEEGSDCELQFLVLIHSTTFTRKQ